MPNTVPASAIALPSAQIIRFPIKRAAGEFNLSFKDWSNLYVTLNIADQFTGMNDAEIEITLREMLKTFPREAESSVYHGPQERRSARNASPSSRLSIHHGSPPDGGRQSCSRSESGGLNDQTSRPGRA